MFSKRKNKASREQIADSFKQLPELVKKGDLPAVTKILADAQDEHGRVHYSPPYGGPNPVYDAICIAADTNAAFLTIFQRSLRTSHKDIYSEDKIWAQLRTLPQLVDQDDIKGVKTTLLLFTTFVGDPPRYDIQEVKDAINEAVAAEKLTILTLLMDAKVYFDIHNFELDELIRGHKTGIVVQLLRNQHVSEHFADRKFRHELVVAIDSQCAGVVPALIDTGVSINFKLGFTSNEHTVLFHAVLKRQYNIAETLIEHGADVGDAIKAAFEYFKDAYIDAIHFLELPDNLPDTQIRAYKQTIEAYRIALKFLLDYAAGVELEKEYYIAVSMNVSGLNFVGLSYNGKPVTKETFALHKHQGADKALFTNADLEKLKGDDFPRYNALSARFDRLYKQRGRLVDTNGIIDLTPLVPAAKHGNLSAVRARLRASSKSDEKFTRAGVALREAAKNGHDLVVDCILGYASKHLSSSDILYVYSVASTSTIRARIGTFIQVDEADKHGFTKLYYAARSKDFKEVRFLLAAGANPLTQTFRLSLSPLSIAITYAKDITMVNLMLDQIADLQLQPNWIELIQSAIQTRFDGALRLLLPFVTVDDDARKAVSAVFEKLDNLDKDIDDLAMAAQHHSGSYPRFGYLYSEKDRRAELTRLRETQAATERMKTMLEDCGLLEKVGHVNAMKRPA